MTMLEKLKFRYYLWRRGYPLDDTRDSVRRYTEEGEPRVSHHLTMFVDIYYTMAMIAWVGRRTWTFKLMREHGCTAALVIHLLLLREQKRELVPPEVDDLEKLLVRLIARRWPEGCAYEWVLSCYVFAMEIAKKHVKDFHRGYPSELAEDLAKLEGNPESVLARWL